MGRSQQIKTMALILNIDTATEHASVCLSLGNAILASSTSSDQKNHAAFVQPAIEQLMMQSGRSLHEIDAVAVTAGPGSYTGLRVGLASAKGICYALQKPLILVDTLEVMAVAIKAAMGTHTGASALFCPLIDARRMEVFTALYDADLQQLKSPHALILDETSFTELLSKHPVVFGGSGAAKLKTLVHQPNGYFSDSQHDATHLAARALERFTAGNFADLAYAEPLYVKEFFQPPARSK